MGRACWLTYSQSTRLSTGSVADRFLKAAQRAGVPTTTIRCSTQTPSSNGSGGAGGAACSPSGGTDDLDERLARLAVTERPANAPPMETYTTTPGPHGDVVSATPEYIRWFRRTYSAAGRADSSGLQASGAAPEGARRQAELTF